MVQFCYLRLYLGIESVSCRLLQRMAGTVVECNLKKLGHPFQVLMLCLQNTPQNYNCSCSLWVKILSIDFITELTQNSIVFLSKHLNQTRIK